MNRDENFGHSGVYFTMAGSLHVTDAFTFNKIQNRLQTDDEFKEYKPIYDHEGKPKPIHHREVDNKQDSKPKNIKATFPH